MVPHVQPPPSPPPILIRSASKGSRGSKSRCLSPTSSDEADDEHSASDYSDMDFDEEPPVPTHSGPPRYPGEDTRLTSKKELAGWYSYAWAAEVYVVCGIGSFIPITLEQLARENGVLLSDGVTPCVINEPVSTSTASSQFSSLFARSKPPIKDKGQCVVHILGVEINTASFAMYTFSLSVLVQALLIISMSGAADHGRYRKKLLLSSALIGSIATMLYLPVVPKVYLLASVLGIISNTCFGASSVLLNSFLPLLVRHHPSVQEYSDSNSSSNLSSIHQEENFLENSVSNLEDSTTALLSDRSKLPAHHANPPSRVSPALQLSTRISSYGVGIGYVAGVLVQLFAVLLLLLFRNHFSTTFVLRLILFCVGLWWLLFTIPAALYLRPRPGPPIPTTRSGRTRTWPAYILYSWRALYTTLKRARHLRDITTFLIAWFLLSDAIATVSGTAVLFAKTELQMRAIALAFINVIATLAGVTGAIFWPRFSALCGWRPYQTIFACIAIFELIPLYGLLPYIPAVRRLGTFGLQQEWEMYALGGLYGFALGGLSSYCRSLFGALIPPGSEAAFYALYAITDKGSSVFGPAIVGAITDRWGEIRPAFVFLAVLVAVPMPLMGLVDVERGRREAKELAEALEERARFTAGGGEGEEEEGVERWNANGDAR